MSTKKSSKQSSRRPWINGWSPVPQLMEQGIGRRLLWQILLFSSAVTLLLTAVQLYLDYRRDVSAIELRRTEIEHSYMDSIANSVWNVDTAQLRVQLEGIVRLPDMSLARVQETTNNTGQPLSLTVGDEEQQAAAITWEIPIVYRDRAEMRPLGVLHVEASLTGVYQRLADKALVILISQGIKTFLVSMFILYLVHRLITRHLATIAAFVSRYDPRSRAEPVNLQRRSRAYRDELDQVVDSLNHMRSNLEMAYSELRQSNQDLAQDIVARRQAEAEVQRLNEILEQRVRQRTAELEAANRELGAFTYSVSHDLRAPLRRIEGFGEMFSQECCEALDDECQNYFGRIRAGVREMDEMVNSFLKLSGVTQRELTIEWVDLSQHAREIVAQLTEKEPERKIRIEIQDNVWVQGDARLLRLVLQNLFDNAWKYTYRTAQPVIAFGVRRENGRQIFFVQDNGAGFDMQYAGQLFTPFRRLHRADEFDGTGIGLATVQRIIARHGGRVWATAEINQGATFSFVCWDDQSHAHRLNPPER